MYGGRKLVVPVFGFAQAAVCVSTQVDAALCYRVKMSWTEFL